MFVIPVVDQLEKGKRVPAKTVARPRCLAMLAPKTSPNTLKPQSGVCEINARALGSMTHAHPRAPYFNVASWSSREVRCGCEINARVCRRAGWRDCKSTLKYGAGVALAGHSSFSRAGVYFADTGIKIDASWAGVT